MKQKICTQPSLLEDAIQHQQALKNGNDHFKSWNYNVIDEFKDLEQEQIKKHLKQNALPFAVCCENVIQDYNIASIFRNGNAMGAKEMFFIGNKKFDRRGLVGIHNYSDIYWLETIDDFLELKTSYKIVGIDNVPGAVSLNEYTWEPNSLLVFGGESVGLTPKMLSMCDDIIYIPMRGSVRSLNVATASGIIMHDFVSKSS